MSQSNLDILADKLKHIKKPYSLEEICAKIDSGEYNAELMLQHLILWISKKKGSV